MTTGSAAAAGGVSEAVVVVGGGIAGITAAETARAQGFTGPIIVLGAEPGLPYRRTALSKDILTADLSPERIRLRAAEYWADRGIEIRPQSAVASIDTDGRIVRLESGDEIGYRAVLLATGARPHAIPNVAATTLRTHDEALALQARLTEIAERGGAVVIIGAGLIGLELAASARDKGIDVTVVDTADRPAPRLPRQVSAVLADLHRAHGVDLQLGTSIASVDGATVTLSNGQTRAADLIVAAIGVRANSELAAAAGIAVSDIGIEVDGRQATSIDGIYAAGDAASVLSPFGGRSRAEHWLAAQDQGKAAGAAIAADLAGDDHVPAPLVPHAWTIQFGVNLQFVGWPDASDEAQVEGDPSAGDAVIRFVRDGELTGAVAIGRAPVARAVKAELVERLSDAARDDVAVAAAVR